VLVTGLPTVVQLLLRSALDGDDGCSPPFLEAEVDAYIAGLRRARRTGPAAGQVRNGHAEPRMITTAVGWIDVKFPG
jgi:hypothetical protein